jgi:hypothetical protein
VKRDAMMRVTRIVTSVALLALSCIACDQELEPREDLGRESLAIIGGTTTAGPEQAAVVALGMISGNVWGLQCTGTMIAKRLVLLSRICVSVFTSQTTVQDLPASSFGVYTGANGGEKAQKGLAPAALGTSMFVPAGSALYPAVAILLLDHDVDAPIAALRLTKSAAQDEPITVAGFGYDQNNHLPSTREQRSGLSVLALGPNEPAQLAKGEFMAGESFCRGDEGAPAFSAKTKAVIGVAVEVTNGQADQPSNPRATCMGSTARAYFNDLVSVKEVFDRAFAAAGAAPKLEAAATTTKDTTSPSASASDPGEPDAVELNTARASTTSDGPRIASSGCSASGSHGSPSSGWWIAFAALAARVFRRQRPR